MKAAASACNHVHPRVGCPWGKTCNDVTSVLCVWTPRARCRFGALLPRDATVGWRCELSPTSFLFVIDPGEEMAILCGTPS
jgi:hypothetical protein